MSAHLPQPGPRAAALGAALRARLLDLDAAGKAPSDEMLDALFAVADDFHRTLFEESGARPRCGAPCASCCSQLVFDVHAFEVERIGRLVAEREAELPAFLAALDRRLARSDEVRREHPRDPGESFDAWEERIAIEFWRLDLPCTLLRADGTCSVHAIRPWSCRRYFSLSDPAWCRGESANDPRRAGFIADPFEEIDELLAGLDRWVPFDAETDRLDLALQRWFSRRGP